MALRPHAVASAALTALLGGAAIMLRQVRLAHDDRAEQIAIGLGARLGNGVLLVVLSWLVLAGEGATDPARALFAALLAALVGGSVLVLARQPDRVVIGYKG